jgi:hypothetical protein
MMSCSSIVAYNGALVVFSIFFLFLLFLSSPLVEDMCFLLTFEPRRSRSEWRIISHSQKNFFWKNVLHKS